MARKGKCQQGGHLNVIPKKLSNNVQYVSLILQIFNS